MKLYRVIVQKTSSKQPGGSFWQREVKYCGPDRDEARQIYHAEEIGDYDQSYGNPARRTKCEIIDDAETDNFDDDPTTIMD